LPNKNSWFHLFSGFLLDRLRGASYPPPLHPATPCGDAHPRLTGVMTTKTTTYLKAGAVEKQWIVVDARDAVVGRLASFIAMRLRGKHRPDYTPNVDCGDHVVVINADKVKFTGRKLAQKTYYWHTGYPGGIKERTAGKVLGGRFPERVLEKAVERMLPKESPLARQQMTHLKLYSGAEHPHEAQNPQVIDFVSLNAKNARSL
jgi:large subunit ribosomal protein L13